MAIVPTGLRASVLAQAAAGAQPIDWWDVARHDIIPVASAYVVFLALLVAYYRITRSSKDRGAGRTAARQPLGRARRATVVAPGWGDLIRHLIATVAGGYVFFLSIVVVFYFVLGGEDRSFIRQALVEGSLLAFILVVPAFLLLTRLEELVSRRRSKPDAGEVRRGEPA